MDTETNFWAAEVLCLGRPSFLPGFLGLCLTSSLFSCILLRIMTHAQLSADLRTEKGRQTNSLRQAGRVPGVLYGFGVEPTNVSVDRNAFNKAYASAGESTVIDLLVDGKSHPVLIADAVRDVLTDFFIHADFRRVDTTRKITAKIPLKLVGESAAVKALGGTLIQALEEIEVTCLPDALVHEIEVDIATLKDFDSSLHVSDIVVPEGITVNTEMDQAVASVKPPRSEAEMAALNAAVEIDVSSVEVTSEKKDEEGADAKKE